MNTYNYLEFWKRQAKARRYEGFAMAGSHRYETQKRKKELFRQGSGEDQSIVEYDGGGRGLFGGQRAW